MKKKSKNNTSPYDVWPPPKKSADTEEEKEKARKKRLNPSYVDRFVELSKEELNAPIFDIDEEKPLEEDENRDEKFNHDKDREEDKDK